MRMITGFDAGEVEGVKCGGLECSIVRYMGANYVICFLKYANC